MSEQTKHGICKVLLAAARAVLCAYCAGKGGDGNPKKGCWVVPQ